MTCTGEIWSLATYIGRGGYALKADKAVFKSAVLADCCVAMQLSPDDIDPTLAVGALNNIIAVNNLTAQFGSLDPAILAANSTQSQLNHTLGPRHLYPLRVGAAVLAHCNESFLPPAQYYALNAAYSSELLCSHSLYSHQA